MRESERERDTRVLCSSARTGTPSTEKHALQGYLAQKKYSSPRTLQ